ncbi:MAG: hypothetical protein JOY82_20710 [Streptosporangiaceae bacterium]|nr:hypothetical protein [Streptosporangiaceae bacterium]MBV9856907.1 hypothetical protein [Streptosporangiaceae bacterium]
MEAALAEVIRTSQVLPGAGAGTPPDALPVAAPLRDLIPGGALARGSVVAVPEFGLLCLALAAGVSAAGAWCGLAGVPELGVLAAAGLGLDTERTLLIPRPGTAWPQVVSSLLDGCEFVLLCPPAVAAAQTRRRLEATLRRARGVLLVAGDWPGAHVILQVTWQEWSGLGDGHGRLRACRAEVMAAGRGAAARPRTRWLWLPAEDGTVAAADALGMADVPEVMRAPKVAGALRTAGTPGVADAPGMADVPEVTVPRVVRAPKVAGVLRIAGRPKSDECV